MTIANLAKTLAALVVLSISAPVIAVADDDGPMGSGMMGMMRMMGMRDNDCPVHGEGMRGMMDTEHLTKNADERLDKIKSELAIIPAQDAAWTAYAASVKASVSMMAAMRQGMQSMMQAGSAKDRLTVRITAMEGMLKALKASQPATDDLYKVLTLEQQKKADALLGAGCGMM